MIGLVFSLWMTKYLPGFVPVYGQILYWYKALIAVTMTLLVVRQFLKRKSGQILLLLTGLLVYSLSLIFHALCLGHFEPAYTGWFEEWGTFILVMCFAVPMALRNTDAGTATVSVKAYSDNYTDTKTAEFTILAAPASGKVTITGADNKVGTELTASVTGNTHILFQFTPLREGRRQN